MTLADELATLARLKAEGKLTDEEFSTAKSRLLSPGSAVSNTPSISASYGAPLPGSTTSEPPIAPPFSISKTVKSLFSTIPRWSMPLIALVLIVITGGAITMFRRVIRVRRLISLVGIPLDRPSIKTYSQRWTTPDGQSNRIVSVEQRTRPLGEVDGQQQIEEIRTVTRHDGRIIRSTNRLSLGSNGYALVRSEYEGQTAVVWNPPLLQLPSTIELGVERAGTYRGGDRELSLRCTATPNPACDGGIIQVCTYTDSGDDIDDRDSYCPGIGLVSTITTFRTIATGAIRRMATESPVRDGHPIVLPRDEHRGDRDLSPDDATVERQLRANIPSSMTSACGYIGATHLVINSISNIRMSSGGQGSAQANVTNSTIFNPPRSCELTVSFAFQRVNGEWSVASLSAVPLSQ